MAWQNLADWWKRVPHSEQKLKALPHFETHTSGLAQPARAGAAALATTRFGAKMAGPTGPVTAAGGVLTALYLKGSPPRHGAKLHGHARRGREGHRSLWGLTHPDRGRNLLVPWSADRLGGLGQEWDPPHQILHASSTGAVACFGPGRPCEANLFEIWTACHLILNYFK